MELPPRCTVPFAGTVPWGWLDLGGHVSKNRVQGSGAALLQQSDGRYHLTVWHRLEAGRMQSEEIVDLSWTEATDCLLTMLDGLRPGWEVGPGWRQPALDADLDFLRSPLD